MRERILNEGWRFRPAEPNPPFIRPHVRYQNWLPAVVPGYVHLDLVRNEVIQDPFVKLGELGCRWVDDLDWTYETEFDWQPTEDLPIRTLVFEGLDTFAKIELNGKHIATAENMFLPVEANVSDVLEHGKNRLTITFRSAVREGVQLRHQYLSQQGLPEDTDFFDERAFVRKINCMWAWDWGPRLVSCGIWKPVRLIEYRGRILGTRIYSERLGNGSYRVRPTATVEGEGEARCFWNGSSQPIRLDEEFVIESPQLWNPNGFGDPHLYSCRFEDSSGQSISKNVGLRMIELVRERDSVGESFRFVVNGIDVWARGANWIPNHAFPSAISPNDYANQIETCRSLGMNMLRVWGGGMYESDAFYDACDVRGILVWQDFPFACSYYPDDEETLKMIDYEARYHIARLADRTSLALWCGNNECHQMWAQDWNLGGTRVDRFHGERIYAETLRAAVEEVDGKTDYNESSPIGSPPDSAGRPDVNANGWGDQHYWDAWHGRGDWLHYQDAHGRFSSEFGFASSCSEGVWNEVLDSDDETFPSTSMLWHDKTGKPWDTFKGFVELHYSESKSLEDWVYFSQLNQRDALRFAIEGFRADSDCKGALIWQFNDCWPVQSWAVQDFSRALKPAGFELQRLYQDVLVCLRPSYSGVKVLAVNHGIEELMDTLIVERIHVEKGVLESQELEVRLVPNSIARIPYEASINDSKGEVLRLQLKSRPESERWHWLCEPKELVLPEPKLDFRTENGQLTINVQGFVADLMVWDAQDPTNIVDVSTRLAGQRSHTIFNGSLQLTAARPLSELKVRSLWGCHRI